MYLLYEERDTGKRKIMELEYLSICEGRTCLVMPKNINDKMILLGDAERPWFTFDETETKKYAIMEYVRGDKFGFKVLDHNIFSTKQLAEDYMALCDKGKKFGEVAFFKCLEKIK